MWLYLRLLYTYERVWFENDVSELLAVQEKPCVLPYDTYGLFHVAIFKQKLMGLS